MSAATSLKHGNGQSTVCRGLSHESTIEEWPLPGHCRGDMRLQQETNLPRSRRVLHRISAQLIWITTASSRCPKLLWPSLWPRFSCLLQEVCNEWSKLGHPIDQWTRTPTPGAHGEKQTRHHSVLGLSHRSVGHRTNYSPLSSPLTQQCQRSQYIFATTIIHELKTSHDLWDVFSSYWHCYLVGCSLRCVKSMSPSFQASHVLNRYCKNM